MSLGLPVTDCVVAPFDVVIVGDAFGLPHGMAATSRIRLYSRALASTGVSVRVMLTTVSESPPNVLNWQRRGVVDGTPYEYTTGTPVRAETFVARRLVEARGIVVAIGRLAALRRSGRRVAILAYMGTSRFNLRYMVLTACARGLHIPVVLELCEAPWSLLADRRPWERVLSPLAFTSGALTISSFLTKWANAEYCSRHSAALVTEVPILVDLNEVRPGPPVHSAQTALYAVSSGYDESLTFVLEAMRHVWTREPRCRLVVTGIGPDELDRCLSAEALPSAQAAMVIGTGRVSRDALLELYSQASVCLAPLFDDQRSQARFPTKIAEYAAAGRPVVTSSVGEIWRYFEDHSTAFVAEPGDATAFGGKIVEALSDPELAAAVGARARDIAETLFDYRVHATRLQEALARAFTHERQLGARASQVHRPLP